MKNMDFTVMMNEPGYESLADVLARAYAQAATGKGKERHARGEPFEEQVMQDGARRFGTGSLLFQAFKKSEESQRLPLDGAVKELLGAINYLAGAVIALEAKGKVSLGSTESFKPQPIPFPETDTEKAKAWAREQEEKRKLADGCQVLGISTLTHRVVSGTPGEPGCVWAPK